MVWLTATAETPAAMNQKAASLFVMIVVFFQFAKFWH